MIAGLAAAADPTPGGWAGWILAAAAVMGGVAYLVKILWTGLLRPGARLISTGEELLPLVKDLTSSFHDVADPFSTLSTIVEVFPNLRATVDDVRGLCSGTAVAIDELRLAVAAIHSAAATEHGRLEGIQAGLDEERRRLDRMASALEDISAWVTTQRARQHNSRNTDPEGS